jgi:hypothetical protein
MPDTPLILISKSAFAARRGVSVSAVSKWIERGRISGPALMADGRIDVAEAERQLTARLDHAKSGAARVAAWRAADPDALPSVGEQSVREQILAVDLEQKRRRLDAEKGVYIRADQVRAERGRALAQMVAALDNWIPELVAELGLDRDAIAKVRASWRRFRERQADALLAEAGALPELLPDHARRP